MPRELSIGTMIGEYHIRKVLGQGGFGITYLAFDEHLDRDVAIKEYFPKEFSHRDLGSTVIPNQDDQDRADFDWGMKHFVEEARSLTRFKHRNIVGAIRFIRENGTAYLVMEYCDGESLESLAKASGVVPENVLSPILSQLLDGLDEVHRVRLLHLDIKPSNIFIKKDGTVVLLDFGSARQAISSHTKSVRIASAGYGAIEQESADIDIGKLGPWTDVYGLGATLYRLMTGTRPQQATARLLQDTLPVPSAMAERGYSLGLVEAVTAALRLKPQDRPQSISEFRDLLAPQLAPKPVSESPASSGKGSTRWYPLAIAGVFLTVIALIGVNALIGFWAQPSESDSVVIERTRNPDPSISNGRGVPQGPEASVEIVLTRVRLPDGRSVTVDHLATWNRSEVSELARRRWNAGLYGQKPYASSTEGFRILTDSTASARRTPDVNAVPSISEPSTSTAPSMRRCPESLLEYRDRCLGELDNDLVRYVGEWRYNRPEGRGKLLYKSSGEEYTGDIVNGIAHGAGEWRFKNGATYTGEFSEGSWKGKGRLVDSNSAVRYVGNFDGARLVIGIKYSSDCRTVLFAGSFKDDFTPDVAYDLKPDLYKCR